jgi:hydroxyacylglutathione hydrolase
MNVVYSLRLTSLNFVNYTYIVANQKTGSCILIDPSWEPWRIEDTILKIGCYPRAILLTHSHFDHVYSVGSLIESYNCDVYLSYEEYLFSGFTCDGIHYFNDGDKLYFDMGAVTCLLTPGHSPGSACFYIDDYLFSGDTLYAEGCGMCQIDGGDAVAMYDSLERLKQVIPGETLIYPGHSFGEVPGVGFHSLIQNNIYLQFEDSSDFVRFRMRKDQPNNFAFK